ncbi:MAG: hypothetical protein ACOCUL_04320, partial [Bacteroidota bacterium]
MKKYLQIFFLLSSFILLCSTSSSWRQVDYRKGMNKNVCKELNGNVLLYFIFVDSKETTPWSEFDIQSTLDSINKAIRWIEKKAKQENINLSLKYDHHVGLDYTTIRKNLPYGTVELSATKPNLRQGLKELNDWSDNIARRAGLSLNIIDKEGLQE